jgi:hypothetical protein
MATDDSLSKKLEEQAIDLDRIIKDAQRLRAEVTAHMDSLRRVRADKLPPIERRNKSI